MVFKDNKAIYLQITERLCDEILTDVYKEDERVPSVREYASTVEVNSNTVMRSYEHLQSEGIIYNKRGIGYFVSAGAKEKIHSNQIQFFMNEELNNLFRQIFTLNIPIEKIVEMYKEYIKNQTKKQSNETDK